MLRRFRASRIKAPEVDHRDEVFKENLPDVKVRQRFQSENDKNELPGLQQEIYVLALDELKQRPEFKQAEKRFLNRPTTDIMIPKPDYNDGDEESSADKDSGGGGEGMSPQSKRLILPQQQQPPSSGVNAPLTDDNALIVPRKLPNPYADSKEKKDLHRELKFNQKIGRNVIGQKSELKKAMDKFQDDQKKKEVETEKLDKRTSLERKLEEQASKIHKMLEQERVIQEGKATDESDMAQSEFHRVHAKVRARVDTQ